MLLGGGGPESAMSFYLRRHSIGPQYIIEIEEGRYARLKSARLTLVDAGAFEQRYELLLGNFTAFEMFCAETSLRGAFEFDFRYGTWARVISEANRHAINFLTTTRQYADHIVRDFKHLRLPEPFEQSAERLLSQAYDSTLAYRFVWELRNFVQHRAIAVHGIKGRNKGEAWTEASMVYCQKKNILEDRGKFKRKVLDQLDEQIDVLLMFRSYMAAVSTVQIGLRKLISEACREARDLTKEAMDEFANAQKDGKDEGNPAVGLTACKGDGRTFTDAIPLLLDWDDTRVDLSKKNSRRIMPIHRETGDIA